MFKCQACSTETPEGTGPDQNLCPECDQPYLVWDEAELPDWNPVIRCILSNIIEESRLIQHHHRWAMRMRHGFAPYKQHHTYDEVSEETHLTRERVRQLDQLYVIGELYRRLPRLSEVSEQAEAWFDERLSDSPEESGD